MKNWMKIGGIAGIILIALTFLNTVRYYFLLTGATSKLGWLNELIFFPDYLLSAFLLILLYLGFFVVSKKYNKKFLKTILSLLLIFCALDFIINLASYLLVYLQPQFLSFLTSPSYFYSSMAVSSIIVILTILFGVGLMTLRKVNKLSFITGILILAEFIIGIIISVCLLVTNISQTQNAGIYFLSIINSIFSIVITLLEVIILFQLSKLKTSRKLNRISKKRKNKR